MAEHEITVKIGLGTARTIAEYCAACVECGAVPPRSAQGEKHWKALESFANAVAGPIYGNPLGDALKGAARE